MNRAAACMLSLALCCGCGGDSNQIDGSSDDAYVQSLAQIRAELEPEQLKEFNRALVIVGMSGEHPLDAASGPEAMLERARRRLDGMTAEDAIQRAAELRKP